MLKHWSHAPSYLTRHWRQPTRRTDDGKSVVHLLTSFESRTQLYGQHSVKSHRLAVTRIDLPRHESPRGPRAPRSRRSKGGSHNPEEWSRAAGGGRRRAQAGDLLPADVYDACHACVRTCIPFRFVHVHLGPGYWQGLD